MLYWSAEKSFKLSDDYKLSVDYFGRRISTVYYNIVNTPSVRAKPYSIQDFSVRLDAKRGWFVAANLNNAFNKRYQIGAFDVTFLGYILRQYGDPRTLSGTFGLKF